MKNSLKSVSAGLFVVVALSFFLPFVAASCNGQRVVQLTGLELVTGTKVEEPTGYGYNRQRPIDAEPLAIIAFIASLAGIGFAFVKGKTGKRLSTASGVVGFIFLLLLQGKLSSDATREAGNMFKLDYLFGFWVALLLLLAAAALNIYLSMKKSVPIGREDHGGI